MIKYLGSKRELIKHIVSLLSSEDCVVCDLFSGAARVATAFRELGKTVYANDYCPASAVIARCYLQATSKIVQEAEQLLRDLQATAPQAGWFTEYYAIRSRYFTPENAAKIEAIRNRIEQLQLVEPLKSVVLTALLEAADRVDSTVGLQMAFLKRYAARALNPLQLRLPELQTVVEKPIGVVSNLDVFDFVQQQHAFDMVYVDPPYNQHSYFANYHIWQTLVLWDRPEIYGIACKRVDCRSLKSVFNSKKLFKHSFEKLIEQLDADKFIVSFSDESFVTREEVLDILQRKTGRSPQVFEIPYRRYVGAKIGIYNPNGEKVGTVKKLHNTEYLFLAKKQ